MNNRPRMWVERKVGTDWVYDNYVCTDPETIYSRLAGMLIAKKINRCAYITRIKRMNNYDGSQAITITQDNGIRMVFVVPDSI